MKYFICGLLIGYFWVDIKWLTFDLLKAIFKGIYNACRVVCFGSLKQGHTRWGAVKYLPKVIWYQCGTYLKWEWLNGCTIGR